MSFPDSLRSEIETLPPSLRAMLEAELLTGNEITEVSHGFPAAPCGVCISLAREITSPAGEDVKARSWPAWNRCSGYTDEKGHFVLVGPPEPEPEQLSMDEIRARINGPLTPVTAYVPATGTEETPVPAPKRRRSRTHHVSAFVLDEAVRRFEESMKIDYDKWREGTGYDLEALREAPPEARPFLEELLLRQSPLDWRDIEALAVLDTSRAREALLSASREGCAAERVAVLRYAPGLVSSEGRTASLVAALRTGVIYGGLTQALTEVEDWHPPEVKEALLRGLMEREGEVAIHFAAMLFYLHGKAAEPFDWAHRPFFLRFHTADLVERGAAFDELCVILGIDPACIPGH